MWKKKKIGDLVTIRNGYAFKSNDFNKKKGVPLVKQTELKGNKVDLSNADYLPEKFLIEYERYIISKGDYLVGMSGSIGKIAQYNYDFPSLQNQRTGLLEFKSDVSKGFVQYYLKYIERKLQESAKGVAVQNISASQIESTDVLVPPLPTQNRIVEKIEELFSELENGVENLMKAQKQLKTYRQAVLKDAFEGKLTKEWRTLRQAQGQDDLPTPEELLQQIKTERKAHRQRELAEWEKEVEQWEEDGKPGRKPRKPRKSKALDPIIDDDAFDIPDKWIVTKFGQVFDVHVGSTPSRKEPDYWNGNIYWVSSGEVGFCQIFDTEEKITPKGLGNSSTSIHPVGTVMLGMIGEGKTRGQAAILKIDAAHNQNTAAIRVSDTKYNPKYVYHFLFYVYERTRNIGSGNNQKALNKERVRNMLIPFCSASEQNEIVNEIESRLSVVDQLEQTIKENLQKAEALRQSILKKAFGGELVN